MQLYNATQTLQFRFSTILDTVLRFLAHFVADFRFLLPPNAPLLIGSKLLREINILVICSLHSKKSIKKNILFPIVLKSFNFKFKYLLLFHSIILLANVFNNF